MDKYVDPIPLYLLRYFLEIRHHEKEKGWLYRRLSDMPFESAYKEMLDVDVLVDLKLIAVSDSGKRLASDDRWVELCDGVRAFTGGTVESILVPDMFIVLSRGRHLLSEYLQKALLWLLAAALGAVIGSLATMNLTNALQSKESDHVERVVSGLELESSLADGVVVLADDLDELCSVVRSEVGEVDQALTDVT